jgi:hypothetical protein
MIRTNADAEQQYANPVEGSPSSKMKLTEPRQGSGDLHLLYTHRETRCQVNGYLGLFQ